MQRRTKEIERTDEKREKRRENNKGKMTDREKVG